MYDRVSRKRQKLNRAQLSRFARGLSYITFMSFAHVKFTSVRMEKLRDSLNP